MSQLCWESGIFIIVFCVAQEKIPVIMKKAATFHSCLIEPALLANLAPGHHRYFLNYYQFLLSAYGALKLHKLVLYSSPLKL